MRSMWLRLGQVSWVSWVSVLAVLPCRALHAQELTLVQPPTTRCLVSAPDSPQPLYPSEQLKLNQAGQVQVELTFTAPDKRPAVKVLSSEGGDAFVNAVRTHVAGLRVPCLDAGDGVVQLIQDYVFKKDDRPVRWTDADPDERRRLEQMKCLRINEGREPPEYLPEARRLDIQGRVLLKLTVSAPDRAPTFETYAANGFGPLADSVDRWAAAFRAPCFTGPPVTLMMKFVFRLDSDPLYGFKRMDFLAFIRNMRDIRSQRVAFDTTQMGCPFDVKLDYLMPQLPNRVAEVGSTDAARKPLLAWLAQAELELNRRERAAVFGDEVGFTVPCVKLNLAPGE